MTQPGPARELHPGRVHGGSDVGPCSDGHDPALATGVCVRCGFDVYGYYDDIPDPNAGRDLDRHADANAALVGLFRRAFIKEARRP